MERRRVGVSRRKNTKERCMLKLMAMTVLGVAGMAFAAEQCPMSAAKECKTENACCGAMAGCTAPVAATAPATQKAPATKVGNTKCIVMPEDPATSEHTVTYEGKEYNLCCKSCKKEFDKDPKKYVAALEKEPEKYGVKK